MAQRFAEDFQVTWFEEPRPSNDLEGLRLLRDHGPAGMDIAAGEYGDTAGYFRDMLQAGAVDCLQADATRCGGYTGFFKVAALCDAFQLPLSAHFAPQLHAHIGCAVSCLRHVEYFHDHNRIDRMLFDGAIEPRNGAAFARPRPPGTRHRVQATWMRSSIGFNDGDTRSNAEFWRIQQPPGPIVAEFARIQSVACEIATDSNAARSFPSRL